MIIHRRGRRGNGRFNMLVMRKMIVNGDFFPPNEELPSPRNNENKMTKIEL